MSAYYNITTIYNITTTNSSNYTTNTIMNYTMNYTTIQNLSVMLNLSNTTTNIYTNISYTYVLNNTIIYNNTVNITWNITNFNNTIIYNTSFTQSAQECPNITIPDEIILSHEEEILSALNQCTWRQEAICNATIKNLTTNGIDLKLIVSNCTNYKTMNYSDAYGKVVVSEYCASQITPMCNANEINTGATGLVECINRIASDLGAPYQQLQTDKLKTQSDYESCKNGTGAVADLIGNLGNFLIIIFIGIAVVLGYIYIKTGKTPQQIINKK